MTLEYVSITFIHDLKSPVENVENYYIAHLSTDVAWREKKFKHFVFYKYFSLVLGLLKSRISEKFNQSFLNKLDIKLFHYKARVQPVSKITTIATRNRCYVPHDHFKKKSAHLYHKY